MGDKSGDALLAMSEMNTDERMSSAHFKIIFFTKENKTMIKKMNYQKERKIMVLLTVFALVLSIIAPFQTTAKSVSAEKKAANGWNMDRSAEDQKSPGNVPVYFEQNNGQFDKRVRYFARGTSGYSLFLTGTEAVYVLRENPESGIDDLKSLTRNSEPETQNSRAAAVFMKLAGANENSGSDGLQGLEHRTNYFKGRQSNWRTDIPNYRQIRMNDVYQGIDTVWHGKQNGEVQYDFVVEPNANPNLIEWQVEGADSVEIDAEGNLLIKTEFGEIRQAKPFTFQENENGLRVEVESRFKIESGNRVGFELGNYDRSKTLTIDPSVDWNNRAFSTYLGGETTDIGYSIAVDRVGNVYVTGRTVSQTFPTTPGTFDTTANGSDDAFVTKMNAAGTALIYSTFIGGALFTGGSQSDVGFDIEVDPSGNAFIAGLTNSPDFPTTSGAFDNTHNGFFDAFVTKLNPTGSALVYSTYLGGDSDEYNASLAIDLAGNALITGETQDGTVDFPTTAGAFDTTHNGSSDVFLTKLNAAGSALVYSTFIGGNDVDGGNGIALDSAGNAVITGLTRDGTVDFPTTVGAFDTTPNGNYDVFVTKFNASGSALVYSTLIGGDDIDSGSAVAVDASGNAYITGYTHDGTIDFPTVPAGSTTHLGDDDGFITKINPTGSTLVYSTLYGTLATDEINDIAVNSNGYAYIAGSISGGSVTAGFVAVFNATGSTDLFHDMTNENTKCNAIAFDSSGNAFVTGQTDAFNFEVTSEAFQRFNNGGFDSFVRKYGDFSISGRTVDFSGLPLANTAVAMSGDGDGFMLSDSQGYFYFGDTIAPSLAGTYLVSATQILYNFNPPNYQVNVDRNKRLTFVGRPTTSGPTAAFAPIGGKVQSTTGNVGLPNTELTLIDTASGQVLPVTTDSNGDYEFQNVQVGAFYLVVPQKEGYSFNPGIYPINHLDENLNVDFLAVPNSPRPVSDFDGDGKTDLAVYRPTEGNWYILESQTSNLRVVRFGLNGDIPVSADYDGDNRADVAVYRPSEGNWHRLNSSNGALSAIHFGSAGDKPVPEDFDGDGKTDLAVYRPSNGTWHKLLSSDGSYQAVKFGIAEDIPTPADYDKDGKADVTVYRNGTWYQLNSSNNQVSIYQFGLAEDKPVRADFDGDGTIDAAIYRPSNGTWYWRESSDGDIQIRQFGIATDIPITADFNGDGRFEQAVYRDGTWLVLRNDNSFYTNQFGQADDIPID